MSTDIFPRIEIPVVSVIDLPGVALEEMADRFVTITERAMTTTVDLHRAHRVASYSGVAVNAFFQEGTDTAAGGTDRFHLRDAFARSSSWHDATAHSEIQRLECAPILPARSRQRKSNTLEQQLYDPRVEFHPHATLDGAGAQAPLPYGGKVRQVMVDIDLT